MFERCLYFNINALTRAVNQHWEKAYQTIGLSPAHAYLLRLVLSTPGITQKQLAAELHLAPSTITRFIDALVKRGLLQRQDSGGDAREWAIQPSDAARTLHSDLERIGQELFQSLRDTLGEAHCSALVGELRRTHDSLQNNQPLASKKP
jgi:MarR family transcriptional regulator, organic hydroperoxide resistance regulator